MYEALVRSRWLIAAFLLVTVTSIVSYVTHGPAVPDRSPVAAGGQVEIIDAPQGGGEEEASATPANPFAARSGEDPLMDRTIGEDVRPEEEKAAEAAAIAAAAAQARMQPVTAESVEAAEAE